MSLSRSYIKYLPGILLTLTIVSVVIIFGSYHNILLNSKVSIAPIWAIFFLVIIIAIGISFYTLLLKAGVTINNLNNEILSIRKTIEDSKVKEIKIEEVVKEKIDNEKEAKLIIPEKTGDIVKFGELLLSNISKKFDIVQGQLYLKDPSTGVYSFSSGYAYFSESEPITYKEGETLAGQAAKNKTVLNLNSIPDNHITILSGLGKGSPKHLLIVPIISPTNETLGVFELASFKEFNSDVEKLFAYIGHQLGSKLVQPAKS